MAYTGVVMTENAAYPVFLCRRLADRPDGSPTDASKPGARVVGLGVMAFTRIQGLALLGAYVTAAVTYA